MQLDSPGVIAGGITALVILALAINVIRSRRSASHGEDVQGDDDQSSSWRDAATKRDADTQTDFSDPFSDPRFAEMASLIKMHMDMTTMLMQDTLANMSGEEKARYFAFELGVIEFHDQVFFRPNATTFDAKFMNFVLFYANKKYKTRQSQQIFDLWHTMLSEGQGFRERKLGFESVSNGTMPDGSRKEGHYPGRYLRDALKPK